MNIHSQQESITLGSYVQDKVSIDFVFVVLYFCVVCSRVGLFLWECVQTTVSLNKNYANKHIPSSTETGQPYNILHRNTAPQTQSQYLLCHQHLAKKAHVFARTATVYSAYVVSVWCILVLWEEKKKAHRALCMSRPTSLMAISYPLCLH